MPSENIIKLKDAAIFQDNHQVLKDVNLEIAKSEFVYLIGKVGTGKTSLLKTLYAELPLKSGSGLVSGFNLASIKSRQIPFLRRKIGVVFQDFQLLTDRSVYENLNFVLKATGWKNKKEIDHRIKNVLSKVDLDYKDYKMPHQISGGEQQRVVIARALLNDPELILADEPTGNLDPETSEDLLKLLMRISANGRAILMSTHNYGLIKKFASRTVKCEKGKLIQVEGSSSYFDLGDLLD